ncbi:hypothetical protein KY092_03930 [Natronomonas gomsonensis]|uniref:hypothetical protein n=1 Tax=Natronomonas gomsonensis TaxID=1046043 RepID=UPI0020CA8C1A|nr:hypothetical protein [Natronomonas gomsonensis]MCY4729708.1 hypothetical protein [Natronomonas gomsonensis]
MARSDDPGSGDSTPDGAGRMLARTWVIAANYRSPADYDIPTAPMFRGERRADGTLVLYGPDGDEKLLSASESATVRR